MLYLFSSSACAPCKFTKEFLNNNNITYKELNHIDNLDMFRKYIIMALPTIVKVDDQGNEIGRVVGFHPEDLLALSSSG